MELKSFDKNAANIWRFLAAFKMHFLLVLNSELAFV